MTTPSVSASSGAKKVYATQATEEKSSVCDLTKTRGKSGTPVEDNRALIAALQKVEEEREQLAQQLQRAKQSHDRRRAPTKKLTHSTEFSNQVTSAFKLYVKDKPLQRVSR